MSPHSPKLKLSGSAAAAGAAASRSGIARAASRRVVCIEVPF
jgi:hypothetical protein